MGKEGSSGMPLKYADNDGHEIELRPASTASMPHVEKSPMDAQPHQRRRTSYRIYNITHITICITELLFLAGCPIA